MAIKHFNSEFFSEIIKGMMGTCKGIEVQQILAAATQVYLAGSAQEDTRQEGVWKKIASSGQPITRYSLFECPFCKKANIRLIADKLDYCSGCGAKMETV